jgi:hypothetical protein
MDSPVTTVCSTRNGDGQILNPGLAKATYREVWSRDIALELYLLDARFESWPANGLYSGSSWFHSAP